MHVFLVRHGETEANRQKRWQGHGDAPLTARGVEQVEALGTRLRSLHFDRVICSDLPRAHTTALAARAEAEHVRIERDGQWREADVGAWEGLTRHEVAAQFAEELALLHARRDVRMGGGESLEGFWARIDAAFDRLVRESASDARVLVVTHGGVIAALVARALGHRGKPSPLAKLVNTGVTRLSVESGEPTILGLNDAAHLGEITDGDERLADGARLVTLRADPQARDEVHPSSVQGAASLSPERLRAWAEAHLDSRPLGALREGARVHLAIGQEHVNVVDYDVLDTLPG